MIEVGPHRFLCGDLMTDAVDRLMDDGRADLLYTDPPWNEGILSVFKKWAGCTARWTFKELYVRLARVARRYVDGWVIVEIGKQRISLLAETMREEGLYEHTVFPCRYGQAGFFYLWIGHTYRSWEGGMAQRAELTDDGFVRRFFKRDETVLDPMIGLGATARMALDQGAVCYGLELNPGRLSKTVDLVRRSIHGSVLHR